MAIIECMLCKKEGFWMYCPECQQWKSDAFTKSLNDAARHYDEQIMTEINNAIDKGDGIKELISIDKQQPDMVEVTLSFESQLDCFKVGSILPVQRGKYHREHIIKSVTPLAKGGFKVIATVLVPAYEIESERLDDLEARVARHRQDPNWGHYAKLATERNKQ